ncbi:MAG: hypothetical protein HYV97_07515 [Bdellovibrio sp.]|nr:hypothetical protein [Bdellovibrio sp.]
MSMKHMKIKCSCLFFGMILFLYGCNSSETSLTTAPPNEGGISEIRPEETGHIKSLISNTGVEWVGEIDSVIAKGAIQASLKRIFNNPSNPEEQNNTNDNGDDDFNVEEFKQDFPRVINLLMANGMPENGGMTYRPEARVCGEILAKNHPAACEEAMARITFFHSSTQEFHGTIIARFDNYIPFIIEYRANSFEIKLSAQNIRAMIVEIDKIEQRNGGEAMEVIPELSGALNLSFSKPNTAQLGLQIIVDQALRAYFQVYDGEVDINIAASASPIAQLSLNKVSRLISLDVDVTAIDAKFPVNGEEVQGDSTKRFWLEASGLAGKVIWNDAEEKIIFDNIRMAATGMWRLNVDDEPALELSFEPISTVLTTSGERLHVKVPQSIYFYAQLFPSNLTDAEGSLTISAQAETELEIFTVWQDGSSNDHYTVLAGSVHVQGTGDLLGELLRLPGEMFRESDTSDAEDEKFPFVAIE